MTSLTSYIHRELLKELQDVNRRIDKLIAQGKFGTAAYKSLCAEHRMIRKSLHS